MKKRANKNKRQKRNQGFSFIHILLILIIIAGLTFLCMSIFIPPKKKDGEDRPLDTVVNETEKKREEEKKKEDKKDEGENQDKTPSQYDGEKPVSSDSFNASITRNEVANGKYSLRISIYELVSNGTCSLHMEANGGKDTLDKTVDIVNTGPDSSSCEGFDVPVEGISSGAYNFTVTMTNGSKTSSVKGVINI